MPGVVRCEHALQELNFAWRLIESTAKMVCPLEAKTILPTMKATRDGFNDLEKELVTHLVQENLAKSAQELHFKAQVIIDIVVRNLFERTADVGFLAMDEAIRDFILDPQRDPAAMVARLRAYRDKYTVYDEILVLDTDGKVLVQLDERNPIAQSHDPLIRRTLGCDTYVETFAQSDLRVSGGRSLIYSRKIAHPEHGAPIGVLCLCFPIAVEMAGVFAGLRKAGDRSVMLMLDADGAVIASSDAEHIAIGRRVPLALDGDYQMLSYAGREYFAKTCAAQDYQGYGGPGWLGHVMIPCETAFRHRHDDALSAYDAATLAGIMSHAKTFCPPLDHVTVKAEAINLSLRRVVWNGKIMSAGQDRDLLRLKSILHEISQTGDETRRLFKNSIYDLYATVISSGLQDLAFVSRLMIDLMDRSLYERANDCRWWALTPDVRRLMAARAATADAQDAKRRRLARILDDINVLYTAYSRLVIFDAGGVIVAASGLQEAGDAGNGHGDGDGIVGRAMDAALVRKTLALPDDQAYCVSPFEPTWLYGDRPTYIYCAAIREPAGSGEPGAAGEPDGIGRVVGGIGVVFDAEAEFSNMLKSSLPRQSGAFAAYADRDGRVISSTHPGYPVGSVLAPAALKEDAAAGEKAGAGAGIVVLDGSYTMIGQTMSFGYREYKNTDNYRNDVIALAGVPIGLQADGLAPGADAAAAGEIPARREQWQNGAAVHEFGIVAVDDDIYALPSSCVIEAIEANRMHAASTLKPLIVGVLNYQDADGAPSAFVPVVNLRYLMHSDARGAGEAGHSGDIIVVRHGGHMLGLLVDGLIDVLPFGEDQIEGAIRLFHSRPSYVRNLIKTADPARMMQVIDVESIVKRVFAGNAGSFGPPGAIAALAG
ncbi:chemotaxis protein CheW [Oxalobacteraceae bacterium CAVE-383]|nr:chemotaxis protein CheW [Oxalobacteraceae bacterium CAVE-383]